MRLGAAQERITAACAHPGHERALREAVLAEIGRVVPFDFHAWLLTDPETEVGTAPLASVPELGALPTLIRLKYLTPVHRWTTLDGVAALGAAPERSLLWRELLAGYGVRDIASTAFRDRFGCWGFLDLWRVGGAFTPAELRFLASVRAPVVAGLRAALLDSFATAPPPPGEPVVLLLDDSLHPIARTPGTDAHLRALLPTPPDRSPVPAAAFNVAAQLLAVEAGIDDHPPSARAHLTGGRWTTLRAARLCAGEAAVAVTLESASPAERLAVYGRAAGLTPRERDLLVRLASGDDTRGAARALGIAESTVTDHLKSIFTKTGAHGRRELLARACG
ncbi:LuxR C-terminal-related transcriptional regulator [Pseudonocardia ailaonensis]|uniref:LuxR C-terminal-related transcriptional regulator n=1 Tax=Pseudonocardia ailaonensis TaxID=367279 RepID=A0ABN2NIY1_9PSEU